MKRPGPAGRWLLVGLVALATAQASRSGPPDDPSRPSGVRKAPSRLADSKAVRERLGLSPTYDDVAGVEAVKVAVLDYGFDGLGQGKGYLPESAEIVENYDPDFVRQIRPGQPGVPQIVRAAQPPRPGDGPDHLVGRGGREPNGPEVLPAQRQRADDAPPGVRYAIEKQVDVILFSGRSRAAASGDGKGPIDRDRRRGHGRPRDPLGQRCG